MGETFNRPGKKVKNDGTGGGGGGGTISVYTGGTGLSNITLSAKGGNGANNYPTLNVGGGCMGTCPDVVGSHVASHGPGGGGGGGVIYTNKTAASMSVAGGNAGLTMLCDRTQTNHGAQPGTTGVTGTSKLIPGLDTCIIVALPVSLVTFTGSINNCKAVLSWKTAKEENFSRFDIEYSTTGIDYNLIGTMPGKQQNTGSSYNFVYTPSRGTGYYRLRMIDLNDAYSLSENVVLTTRCGGEESIKIAPNPAATMITITGLPVNCSISIVDAVGTRISTLQSKNASETIDISRLTSGMYVVRIIDEGTNITNIKLLKN